MNFFVSDVWNIIFNLPTNDKYYLWGRKEKIMVLHKLHRGQVDIEQDIEQKIVYNAQYLFKWMLQKTISLEAI